jgi:sirohydrochlorin ferrochelatase
MHARALLLVDHGSRVPAANAQLAELARLVQLEAARDGDPDLLVQHAHMELCAPSIDDAIDALAARGVRELVLVPYFLAPGRHATEDIPRLAHEAAARHPELRVRIAECLGVHELLAKLVLVRARG